MSLLSKVGLRVDVDCAPGDFQRHAEWWLRDGFEMAVRGFSGAGRHVDPRYTWGFTLGGDSESHSGRPDSNAIDRLVEMAETPLSFDIHAILVDVPGCDSLKVSLEIYPLIDELKELEVYLQISGAHPEWNRTAAAEFLWSVAKRYAETFEPDFMGISDDMTSLEVALDSAHNLNSHVARKGSSQYLRSYAWVTYVPERMVQELGGVVQIGSASLFERIESLPHGVMLRATEHLDDYHGDIVRGVRNILRPVLRDLPTKFHPRKTHLRIAWDDGRNGPITE
jgi:hypothetical protein